MFFKEVFKFLKSDKSLYLIAIMLIISGGFLVYSPHAINPAPIMDPPNFVEEAPLGEYYYPLHVDGWNHVARAKHLREEGKLFVNPLTSEKIRNSNLEFGFHIILALFSIILFMPVLKFSFLIPTLFFVLGASLLFLYFDKVLKKRKAGLFALLLLMFMKSNVNVLGNWFLVPLITFLTFFLSFVLVYHRMNKSRFKLVLLVLIFIIASLVYPFTGLFILFYWFIYEIDIFKKYLFSFKDIFQNKVYPRHFYGILSISLLMVLALIYYFSSLIDLSSLPIIFKKGWTAMEYSYYISDFLSPIFILLSLVGLYLVYNFSKKLFAYLVSLNIYFVLMTLTYYLFNFTVLIPYQRILYFWQIFLIISLAFALDFIFSYMSKWISGRVLRKHVTASFVILFLLFSVSLAYISIDDYYYPEPDTYVIQKLYSEDKNYLLNQMENDSVVLADNFLSVIIYPLTGNKVVNCINANIGCKDDKTYDLFIRSGCSVQEKIAKEKNIDYVFSYGTFYCPSFRLIDSRNNYYLYQFDDN